ncbi:MAG TPA: heterodisulfide reductase-related iron-sulfur binding cluster [Planctomycetota bacterium]|nr:heterodisulfide reductase-related iron-sulfur binding cluster [Planctomycetota bacterium]
MSVATFAYYPGCLTLESAREYDASIRALCRVLDIALEEVDDWNCCGAGVLDDAAAAEALANRVLERAGDRRPVVSGCPTCVVALQAAGGPDAARHVLAVFTEPAVRERICAKIAATGAERPLGAMKVACFYGRALSNPALWGGTAEGESWPMDVLSELSGATVVKWGGSRRSAGGYVLMAKPEAGFEMLAKVFRDFEKSGADAIVTADPHAHFNLDAFQYEIGRRRRQALEVPVFHVTELVALAMELEPTERWLDRHVTGTLPLLDRLCAEEDRRRAAK